MNQSIKKYLKIITLFLTLVVLFLTVAKLNPTQAAVDYKQGNFTKPVADGDQSISGVGFQPKAIIFYQTNQVGVGTTANGAYFGLGFASSDTTERSVSYWSDINDPSDAGRMGSETYVINMQTVDGALAGRAVLKSFDANGFTLTWSNVNSGAYIIQYTAIGGSDVTNAQTGSFTLTTGTGNLNVTGVGFKPEFVMFISANVGTTYDTNTAYGKTSIGFADGTNQGAVVWNTEDNQGTSDTWSRQMTDNAILLLTNAGAADALASFSSMNDDGFTINKSDAPAANTRIFYLAIRGGQNKVSSFTSAAGTGDQGISGVGFRPVGLFMTGNNLVGSTAIGSHTYVSIGAGSSNNSQGAIAINDRDADGAADPDQRIMTDKIYTAITGATPTLVQEGALTTFDSDGFTINWSVALARPILYWTIGSDVWTPVSGTTNVSSGVTTLAINGNLGIGQSAAISSGTWSINGRNLKTDDIITTWIENAATADESTAVTKYDGSGPITEMVLNAHSLSVGSTDNQSLILTDLGLYDNDQDEDIMHSANASTLNVDDDSAYTDAKIDILSGDTLTISGTETLTTHDVAINGTLTSGGNSTYNISGSWDNNSIFTCSTSTAYFNAGSGTESIDSTGASTSTFYNLQHTGASTLQLVTALDVNGDFSQTTGTFNANSQNQNFAGAFALSLGTTYTKGGTLTFDNSSSSTVSDATASLQDLGTVVIDGSSKTITTSTNIKLTTLNIGADDTFNISDDTLTILGSGTPFTKSGTFTTTSSTVIYAGTLATNVTTAVYNNLTFTPASGTPTYSLAGNLTSGNALTGNLTISSGATLDTTGSNYGITLPGNWSSAGNFTANASTVTFSKSSSTQTVNNNGSAFWHVIHSGAGTLQLETNGLDVNGDFPQTDGVFNANSLNQNYAGAFSLSLGTTYTKGGTLTFDGSGSSAVSDATAALQDLGTVVIDGSTKTITSSTNIKTTTITIGANDTFNIANDTLTILGSGTPFVITAGGTFTTTASTVIYAGTTDTNITTTAYNNLTLTPSSGTPTYSLTGHLTSSNVITGNLTINSGATLNTTGSNYNITLGGSWDNNGTFTSNNSTVTFNATSTGKTVEAGSSPFYKVIFNSATGGWTIQTNNLTVTNDFTITDTATSGFTVNGATLEVQGTYTIADAETANTTWTSATLYLNSASAYTVGSKTQTAETYDTLQIGNNTDIRLWNSTAGTFTVSVSGSLYSQDHANTNGDLYIWGDYHTATAETSDHDYWSYNNDFDGTDITGSPRQVDVRIDPSATATVDSGDTLAAVGASGINKTTVSRQGGSGGYNIVVANGGTIDFEYTDFDYLEGTTGLNIQSGATVTSLDYTDFDNLVGSVATDDAYITVASTVIGSGTKTITGVNFDESDVTVDFNVNRTGSDDTGYWDFDVSSGTFDGESYDGDDGVNEANPGMLRWDDSSSGTNYAPTTPTSLSTEGATNPTTPDTTPEFTAIYNDPDNSDIANNYQIQVDDDPGFGSTFWDSTKTAITNCVEGNRCVEITYGGSALNENVTYYWRIKFWDDDNEEGSWSTGSNWFKILTTSNSSFRDVRLRDIRINPNN